MKARCVSIFSIVIYLNLASNLLAFSDEKLSCEQMKLEINQLAENIELRTIDYSEIPGWYFGIPGLMRFGEVIDPALEETDRVFGQELRMDIYEKNPQVVYNTVFAMAYPTVMAALVPGDIAKVSYFALTKAIMEKRLGSLTEIYEIECEFGEPMLGS
ncbi:MAG: hypothetical protein AB8G05_14020 [Oligoflexales bacterium]